MRLALTARPRQERVRDREKCMCGRERQTESERQTDTKRQTDRGRGGGALTARPRQAVAAGMNPTDIRRGIEMSVKEVVTELNSMASKVRRERGRETHRQTDKPRQTDREREGEGGRERDGAELDGFHGVPSERDRNSKRGREYKRRERRS